MRKLFLISLFFLPFVIALTLPPNVQKLIAYHESLAMNVTFLIAFVVGFFSLTSPCGFVLIPAFFTYAFKERKKAFWMSLVFSLGLILAFSLVGLIAGAVGDIYNDYKSVLATISGLVLLYFGYLVLNNRGFGGISFKQDVGKKKTAWSVFLLGGAFAFGWSPCVGPVLSGIIVLAANLGNVIKSTLLLATYAFGAVLPLIILAYFSDRFEWAMKWRSKPVLVFGKKVLRYNLIAGVLLLLVGLLMILYQGTQFFQRYIPQFTGWTMEWWNTLAERLMQSSWTQSWANWVGGLLVVVILGIIFYLQKKRK